MNVVWVLPVSFTYGSMEIENSTPRAFAATKIMAASRAQLGSVHSAVWATWRAETCLSWSRQCQLQLGPVGQIGDQQEGQPN